MTIMLKQKEAGIHEQMKLHMKYKGFFITLDVYKCDTALSLKED
jgi:hypothetical protein